MNASCSRGAGGRAQRGAVLVLVLWILALLTFLLGAYSSEIRVENRVVGDLVGRIRLRAGATAVLNYLALAGSVSPESLTALEGLEMSLPLGTESVAYRLVPEEAYVSLNAAPPEMLKALIANYPGGDIDVDALVDTLVDWRDEDGVASPHGAEAAEYERAGFAYGPRNAPFVSVDELIQLPGFDQELVDWLRPYVSAASMSAGIDPGFADARLVHMLDTEGRFSDEDLEAMQADPLTASGMVLESAFFAASRSGVYRVLVQGEGDDGLKRPQAIEVTAAFQAAVALPPAGVESFAGAESLAGTASLAIGPAPAPYRIIQWNEYPPIDADGEP